MAFVAQLLSLAWPPVLERVLLVPNLVHFTMMVPTVLPGPLVFFIYLFIFPLPKSVSTHFNHGISWTSSLVFWSNMHCKLRDLVHMGVCLSKSCPVDWICHRWTAPDDFYRHVKINKMELRSVWSVLTEVLNNCLKWDLLFNKLAKVFVNVFCFSLWVIVS